MGKINVYIGYYILHTFKTAWQPDDDQLLLKHVTTLHKAVLDRLL
jgi:hypothetical protein